MPNPLVIARISTMTDFLRNVRFPFMAICFGSLALVGGGVTMAHFMNLAACPLCIIQRMLYLLLGLIAGIGIAAAGSHSGRIGMALITASVAGTGVFVAGYQVWIQRFAQDTNCAAQAPWWEQMVDWAGERIPFFFQANGLCSDPAWKFLGLSIAEWSLVAFTTMLALALLAASGRLATGSSDR